jgi:Tfp pilus assembly PilM family ATPase
MGAWSTRGAIVQGLNTLWSQLKLKRKEVSLAVSGHAVIVRASTCR